MTTTGELLGTGSSTTRSRALRRARGIYYSPEDVAQAMIDWAIRSPDDTVFDPSFGGCVFLRAALGRLEGLGATEAPKRLFGTDWDSAAWQDAARLIELGAEVKQFRQGDFLAVRPAEISGPFRAVVGNPPYVRPHELAAEAQRTARAALPEGVGLSAKASYWGYFVIHALDFVAPGGRLALILPGAFLHADYAGTVREQLLRAFGRITVVALRDRVFPEAQEETVLLMGENRGAGPGLVWVGEASRADLALDDEALAKARPLRSQCAAGNWGWGLVDPEALSLYETLVASWRRLGSVARMRIGVVTGAKRFFLVPEELRHRWRLEDEVLRPVVARTAQLRGLDLTSADLAAGDRVRLFVPPAENLPAGAARYVGHGEKEGVHKVGKCVERDPWYVLRFLEVPDGFLTSMAWAGPRLALNRAQAVCTNTLLAVHFQPEVDGAARRALAAGALSTVAQLSAELEGRGCGGGLLKIEPSDAARLVIPAVEFDERERSRLETLCRAGLVDEARDQVDSKLLALEPAMDLGVMRRALEQLRLRRKERGRRAPNTLSHER